MNTHSRIGGKTCLAGAVLLLSASLLSGSEITLRAETEREDALYRSGEKIVFRVCALDQSGKMAAGQKLDYTIRGDGAPEQSGTVLSGAKPVEITTRLDHPGFVLLTVSVRENGKIRKTWAGAGVDVLKIRAATPETPSRPMRRARGSAAKSSFPKERARRRSA